ncbi:hypothetical protein SAMD00019534_075280, partial [Acytostelium subglobosum LB1]|uniref:hypothetical protein n=1 Tax=Acytostelium subglobosum LB1 TaxID=1410327 RepID=UPI000644E633
MNDVINVDDDDDDQVVVPATTTTTTTSTTSTSTNRTGSSSTNTLDNKRVPIRRPLNNKRHQRSDLLASVHERRLLQQASQPLLQQQPVQPPQRIQPPQHPQPQPQPHHPPKQQQHNVHNQQIIDQEQPRRLGNPVSGNNIPIEQSSDLRKQLDLIRRKKHQEYRNDKLSTKKMYTLSDLGELQKSDNDAKMYFASLPSSSSSNNNRSKVHTIGNTFMDPEAIGRKSLELTNAFRKTHNKPPLQWHQALYTIGVEHSKNMAENKVAFGHDGFDNRVSRFPFAHQKSGENVAMNNMDATVAETAVEGWIHSKGHRENLLGHFNICSIGVYQSNDGKWYLTQLFALT